MTKWDTARQPRKNFTSIRSERWTITEWTESERIDSIVCGVYGVYVASSYARRSCFTERYSRSVFGVAALHFYLLCAVLKQLRRARVTSQMWVQRQANARFNVDWLHLTCNECLIAFWLAIDRCRTRFFFVYTLSLIRATCSNESNSTRTNQANAYVLHAPSDWCIGNRAKLCAVLGVWLADYAAIGKWMDIGRNVSQRAKPNRTQLTLHACRRTVNNEYYGYIVLQWLLLLLMCSMPVCVFVCLYLYIVHCFWL